LRYPPRNETGSLEYSTQGQGPISTALADFAGREWENLAPRRVGMGHSVELAFSRALDFRGRSSRSEYWWFVLFNLLTIAFAYALILVAEVSFRGSGFIVFLLLVAWLAVSALLNISLTVRRLHDLNHTGWLLLLQIVPVVNLVFLAWMAAPGTPGANKFGPGYVQDRLPESSSTMSASARSGVDDSNPPSPESLSEIDLSPLHGRAAHASGSVFDLERTRSGIRFRSCTPDCGGDWKHGCSLSSLEAKDLAQAVWVAGSDDPNAIWKAPKGLEVARRNTGSKPPLITVSWQVAEGSMERDRSGDAWRCSALLLEGDPRDASTSAATFLGALRASGYSR